ncbi:hypothetical protein DENSPDRAFT_854896 [Dentipellis sp. KUC8613]|nr:hypothetical protein DENSPDRAFT_854896 [Dentipellis sp. KUC8613]
MSVRNLENIGARYRCSVMGLVLGLAPLPPKTVQGHPVIPVEITVQGKLQYLPYDPTWHSNTKMKLVQDIVNKAYENAGGSSRGISWKALSSSENEGCFIEPEFLPENFKWQDPSHLSVADVASLLSHWEQRREEGKAVLAFKAVMVGDKLVNTADIISLTASKKSTKKKRGGKKPPVTQGVSLVNTEERVAGSSAGKKITPKLKAKPSRALSHDDRSDSVSTDEENHSRSDRQAEVSPPRLRQRPRSKRADAKQYDDVLGPRSSSESDETHSDEYKEQGSDDETGNDRPELRLSPDTDLPAVRLNVGKTKAVPWQPRQALLMWAPGNERVSQGNDLFPIMHAPPPPSSASSTSGTRMDFIRKLIHYQAFREIINVLEDLEILPPLEMTLTIPGTSWMSWHRDVPWISPEWWTAPDSIKTARSWMKSRPFLTSNGGISEAGVWATLFAFGMIAREMNLADKSRWPCYKDCSLGSEYLSGAKQITQFQRGDWFLVLQIYWLPSTANCCLVNLGDRMKFLNSLSPSLRYQKLLNVLKELDNDVAFPDTEVSELRPDWATWDSNDTWAPTAVYTDPLALDVVVDWFSATSDDSPGWVFMGLARFSEMALALGMLLREWVLYKLTRTELGPFDRKVWTKEKLGPNFPPGPSGKRVIRPVQAGDQL